MSPWCQFRPQNLARRPHRSIHLQARDRALAEMPKNILHRTAPRENNPPIFEHQTHLSRGQASSKTHRRRRRTEQRQKRGQPGLELCDPGHRQARGGIFHLVDESFGGKIEESLKVLYEKHLI